MSTILLYTLLQDGGEEDSEIIVGLGDCVVVSPYASLTRSATENAGYRPAQAARAYAHAPAVRVDNSVICGDRVSIRIFCCLQVVINNLRTTTHERLVDVSFGGSEGNHE